MSSGPEKPGAILFCTENYGGSPRFELRVFLEYHQIQLTLINFLFEHEDGAPGGSVYWKDLDQEDFGLRNFQISDLGAVKRRLDAAAKRYAAMGELEGFADYPQHISRFLRALGIKWCQVQRRRVTCHHPGADLIATIREAHHDMEVAAGYHTAAEA